MITIPAMFFDLIGALVSITSTYFFIRSNNKAWPVGMIATLVNGWLYWHKGIYADMLLEFCYFLSMGYGWYNWNKKTHPLTLSCKKSPASLKPIQWILLGLITGALFLVMCHLLKTLVNSNIAIFDAATTTLSLIAQWLMCHKIIFTWVLWFITDALYAAMYLSKDLPFHCALMIIYTGMAITGYWVWTRTEGEKKSLLPKKTNRIAKRRTQNSDERLDLNAG